MVREVNICTYNPHKAFLFRFEFLQFLQNFRLTILRKVIDELGGGLSGNVSVWGVENRISVSLQAIKVGEAPERSQGCKGEAPSACMQPGHD